MDKKGRIATLTGGAVVVAAIVIGIVLSYESTKRLSPGLKSTSQNLANNATQNGQTSTTNLANNDVRGYLYDSPNNVMFIQYTSSSSGNLSGAFYEDYEDTNNKYKTYSSPITGILNGSNISITISNSGQTYTGNLDNGILNLAFPQNSGTVQNAEFQQGTLNDYNQDVSQLQSTVSSDQAAQQQAQQTADLQKDLQNMESDVSGYTSQIPTDLMNITTVISQTGKDISHERADLQTTYQDLQTVLNEPSGTGQAGADAGKVGADSGAVGADDGSINADQGSLSSAIDTANSDASSLKSAFDKMTSDAASLGVSIPSNIPTSSDVSSLFTKEQKAVGSATSEMNQYLKQSQGMVNEANQYADKANSAAN